MQRRLRSLGFIHSPEGPGDGDDSTGLGGPGFWRAVRNISE
jgi:hypothetical protein